MLARAPTAPHQPLDVLGARAQYYVESARAARTRLAYECDFAAFARWCVAHGLSSLPASPGTLACYLTHLAENGRKISTVRRANGDRNRAWGCRRPSTRSRSPHSNARARHGRVHGKKAEGAEPLVIEHIERIVEMLGASVRDRAARSAAVELVAIRIEDLHWRACGMDVFLRRSKEDPLAAGTVVKIDCATARKSQSYARCRTSALPFCRRGSLCLITIA